MAQIRASERYDRDWLLYSSDKEGLTFTIGRVNTILLHEIRDELKKLNALLSCSNFVRIPKTLIEIRDGQKATPRRGRKRR